MSEEFFTPEQRQKLVDQLETGLHNGMIDHGPGQWAALWSPEGIAVLEAGLLLLRQELLEQMEKLKQELRQELLAEQQQTLKNGDLKGWKGKK